MPLRYHIYRINKEFHVMFECLSEAEEFDYDIRDYLASIKARAVISGTINVEDEDKVIKMIFELSDIAKKATKKGNLNPKILEERLNAISQA